MLLRLAMTCQGSILKSIRLLTKSKSGAARNALTQIGDRRNISIFPESRCGHLAPKCCMPRFARAVVPDAYHHVTQRGNARRDVFFSPQDRHVYLGLLKEYSMHYGLRVMGYSLMTNHVHLVVKPTDQHGLAKTMREIHGRYSRYRNAIDQSNEHVWQCRFYSCAFEGLHLASVMRYVELNPVRAGLVAHAGDYAWSSAI